MTYYAGLDVSLKEVSICIVDYDGALVLRSSIMMSVRMRVPQQKSSFMPKVAAQFR